MSTLKTQPTAARVGDFLDGIEDPVKRKDCRELADIDAGVLRELVT